jgi:hypothetical protein
MHFKVILIRILNELTKLKLFPEISFMAHSAAFSDSHLSSVKVNVKYRVVV